MLYADGQPTYSMESGYAMAMRLLESGKEFTCIYAISDNIAVGACKALFNAGKKVPDDYSVASFDGLPLRNIMSRPLLPCGSPERKWRRLPLSFCLI